MHLSLLFLRSFFNMLVVLAPLWGVLAIIISILGICVGVLEGLGWQEGLYFGWVTGTTVGYGDIVPLRPISRLLSIIIGVIGIVNTGIIVTIAVSAGKIIAEHHGMIDGLRQKMTRELQEKSQKEKQK